MPRGFCPVTRRGTVEEAAAQPLSQAVSVWAGVLRERQLTAEVGGRKRCLDVKPHKVVWVLC